MIFTIPGRLPALNDYTKVNRGNKYAGNNLKKETQQLISFYIPKKPINTPIRLIFNWYEPNKKRDKDNIAFAKKFILDALVNGGCIPNDGWKEIEGFQDNFYVDKDNPRIEVEIIEE